MAGHGMARPGAARRGKARIHGKEVTYEKDKRGN